jgi:hypothetical protein
MSTDFEDQLRKALARVDPEEGFAERVLARLDAAPPARLGRWWPERFRALRAALSQRWLPRRFRELAAALSQRLSSPARARALPVALAASALLGTVLIYGWHVDRERRGLEARRQLIQALHITGEKLDVAYRGVMREPSQPAPSGDSGA